MLDECQGANLPFDVQRMCRSQWNLCSCPYVVRASKFMLNLVWTFCAFSKKITSCRFSFFLWHLFAAGASVKRERTFGTPVLRRSRKIRVKRKTLIHRCLLWWTRRVSALKLTYLRRFIWSRAPLLHILSIGNTFRLGDLLAIGSKWREEPLPIFGMQCARRRCESNSRCRCSPSMAVFAASFCIGIQPKRDCVAFLA